MAVCLRCGTSSLLSLYPDMDETACFILVPRLLRERPSDEEEELLSPSLLLSLLLPSSLELLSSEEELELLSSPMRFLFTDCLKELIALEIPLLGSLFTFMRFLPSTPSLAATAWLSMPSLEPPTEWETDLRKDDIILSIRFFLPFLSVGRAEPWLLPLILGRRPVAVFLVFLLLSPFL